MKSSKRAIATRRSDKMSYDSKKKELIISKEYDAPVEKLWASFTDQEIVSKWWGPNGVTIPVCEIEPRPGGKIKIVMLAGEELGPAAGQEWPMIGTFLEVVRNEKLVFTSDAMQDGDESKTMIETKTTITFEKHNKSTIVTVHVLVTRSSDTPEAKFAVQGMGRGWNQQMDKLGAMIAAAV